MVLLSVCLGSIEDSIQFLLSMVFEMCFVSEICLRRADGEDKTLMTVRVGVPISSAASIAQGRTIALCNAPTPYG